MDLEAPEKICELFEEGHGVLRWRGAYGGRGSGKSFNIARMALLRGLEERRRILCTRDIQASIAESFYAELREAAFSIPWLAGAYHFTKNSIVGRNGTEFLFRGLRHNLEAIKSMARIDIAIIEEAEDVGEEAWRKLVPTIRSSGSEFWPIWNPEKEGSPIDMRMRKNPPPRSKVVEMNYRDNPWFPAELEEERQHDMKVMHPNLYAHIWEGEYLVNTEAQILAHKLVVDDVVPKSHWDGPYHGMDFGFSQDPTAAVKVWIADNRIYVEKEAGRTRLELTDTARYVQERIEGIERYEVVADSARPESISFLKAHGLPRICACKKWPGSVEDGIEHMLSYEAIVVDPSCVQTIRECRLYSYKVDRLSGQVLTAIIDAHNHFIDAIRYALDKVIRSKRMTYRKVKSV